MTTKQKDNQKTTEVDATTEKDNRRSIDINITQSKDYFGPRKLHMYKLDKAPFLLMRDIKPERFSLPPNSPFPFHPFVDLGSLNYRTISPAKKDPVTYVKLKDENLWLYENKDGTLRFNHLERFYTGFVPYKNPQVFWLNYIYEQTFIMYKPTGNTVASTKYVYYNDDNGTIVFKWVDNAYEATFFYFGEMEWEEFLTQNILARITFTDAQLRPELYRK